MLTFPRPHNFFTHLLYGDFYEFSYRMCLTGGNNIVIGVILLEHEPHGFDILLGVAPVALGVEVAEVEVFLFAEFDGGDGTEILRVTKVSPRRGDSWLKRMPFVACMPQPSR